MKKKPKLDIKKILQEMKTRPPTSEEIEQLASVFSMSQASQEMAEGSASDEKSREMMAKAFAAPKSKKGNKVGSN